MFNWSTNPLMPPIATETFFFFSYSYNKIRLNTSSLNVVTYMAQNKKRPPILVLWMVFCCSSLSLVWAEFYYQRGLLFNLNGNEERFYIYSLYLEMFDCVEPVFLVQFLVQHFLLSPFKFMVYLWFVPDR